MNLCARRAEERSFDAHYDRIRDNPDCTILAVDDDGVLVGMVSSFPSEVGREVTYRIDPGQWWRGLASAALRSFLDVEPNRPLFARVAVHRLDYVETVRRYTGRSRISGHIRSVAGTSGKTRSEVRW